MTVVYLPYSSNSLLCIWGLGPAVFLSPLCRWSYIVIRNSGISVEIEATVPIFLWEEIRLEINSFSQDVLGHGE